jgi:hypothetical protein
MGQQQDQGNWPGVKIKEKRALSHECISRKLPRQHPFVSLQNVRKALSHWPLCFSNLHPHVH